MPVNFEYTVWPTDYMNLLENSPEIQAQSEYQVCKILANLKDEKSQNFVPEMKGDENNLPLRLKM